MKSQHITKLSILIAFTFVFIIFFNILNQFILFSTFREERTEYVNNIDEKNIKLSKISGSIYINNDSTEFNWIAAKTAGICTGEGTFANPYIIKDLLIDASGSNYGIKIENSNAYLKIINCTIYNSTHLAGWGIFGVGIEFYSVNNTQLINNNCSNNTWGIYINEGYNNKIYGNNVNYNDHGLFLQNSHNVIITGNTVNNSKNDGIEILGSNITLSGNIMNRWGLKIDWYWDTPEMMGSHNIDDTNLMNGKPIYYYVNEKNLGSYNFTNAGQVFMFNCSDSIISNLNISHASAGISVNLCNNISILGNSLNNNIYGIIMEDTNNTLISGNTVNNNIDNGIYLSGNNLNISGNTANDNSYGVRISGSSNFLLGNIVNNSLCGGISIMGSNNMVSGNIMNRWGLEIEWDWESPETISTHNIDDTNLLNGKPIYYYANENNLGQTDFTNAGQIFLVNCKDSIISDVNISFCTKGISLYFSQNITISKNTVKNSSYGIYISNSHNNDVLINIIINNTIGIHLRDSELNDIVGNIVNNNGDGIDISFSSFNYISGNTVNNNDCGISLSLWRENIVSGNTVDNNYYGIYIMQGDNCTIVGNIISNNVYGIYLLYQCSHHNIISANTFHNNTYNYFEYNTCNYYSNIIWGYNQSFIICILIALIVYISSLIKKSRNFLITKN